VDGQSFRFRLGLTLPVETGQCGQVSADVGQQSRIGNQINDGAFDATMEAMRHNETPNFCFLRVCRCSGGLSLKAGDEDHNSRSERLHRGNQLVAGLGSQTIF
jgi:hypothetical protein